MKIIGNGPRIEVQVHVGSRPPDSLRGNELTLCEASHSCSSETCQPNFVSVRPT